jgi:hypothetical protein
MPNSSGIPRVPCCPENGGGDLMPLLLVVIVLWAAHIAIQEFKKRKEKSK